jgi:hypothetical protein
MAATAGSVAALRTPLEAKTLAQAAEKGGSPSGDMFAAETPPRVPLEFLEEVGVRNAHQIRDARECLEGIDMTSVSDLPWKMCSRWNGGAVR